MTTFEDAKVGDKVWNLNYGWGVIEYINKYKSLYPIKVGFEVSTHTYTYDGKSYIDHISQSLFWDEVIIKPPEKPLPKLEVDTKVLVWDKKGFYKTKAYFSHFDSNNKICVFSMGRTSWSNDSNTQSWTYWELEDNNKCK